MIDIHPDEEYVREIKAAIKANGGHRPSQFPKSKATKCKCKEFKEQIERGHEGYCRCGLYVFVND